MDQKQIMEKYEGYTKALTDKKLNEKDAALLVVADVISNLSLHIKRQTWKELADELSKMK